MRTTITLSDEAYEKASVYAAAKGITLGSAIGELVLRNEKGVSDEFLSRIKIGANGIPVLRSRGGVITSEMIKAAEEEEFG